ncbi:methionyl-tRNA formyltransferase [Natrinema caseinilyticum]|uniref:methionyl-tRNA formyltransferase n=1 Tax=Natrinema caseinilyticum TaxID=2961570 RepID=UPI0020C461F2|nr:formyltransferase family protein [Natrinema caseinilyticum]
MEHTQLEPEDEPIREPRIVFASCTDAGFDLFRYVHEELAEVTELVSLTPEQGERNGVCSYYDHAEYAAEQDISVYYPQTYGMDERDVDHFVTLDADLLLVHGWQRLIPGDVLESFTRGALGLHGSAFGLPKGRGRSPMNWSLIEDLDRFLLSVMHLDEGADSGDVVATQKFDINRHDDIQSLYHKLVMTGQQLFDEILDDVLAGTAELEVQTAEPTYYPKRNPEDGAIHWEDSTRTIYNLVRAVARPYPGAFTEHDGTRVTIWDAQPFSADLLLDERPGTVVQVFQASQQFVVKTSDGTLLVTDWEGENWDPERGMVLESLTNELSDSPNRIDRPEHEDSLTR